MINALNFQNPIIVGKLASDPASPVNGAIYYNTTSNTLKIYQNGAWATLSTGSVSLIGQSLNDHLIIVGNGSNLSASVDTSAVGDVLADATNGLTIQAGVIVNSMIASGAAIAYSKLNLAASVQASDQASGAATSTQPLFANGSGGAAYRSIASGDIPDLSATYVTQSEVGAANGVASLNGSGKIPVGQLPADVFVYQGTWDPTTNTPSLADGTGTAGYVYWVSAAKSGTVSGLNNASMTNFQIGDLVLYNGTQWELTTPAAGVQSVNGSQGAVTVDAINQLTGDVTAGPASGSASAAATIAAGAVTATKLGTVTDGITLDQSGAGSTLEVKAGGISNTQIASSAGIAYSKLAALTVDRIPVTDHSTGFVTDADASNDKALISNSFQRGASGSALVKEQYIDSTTLTDNTSSPATAFSFALASFRAVEIAYLIENGGATPDSRAGTLRVAANSSGSNISITDTMIESADCGVSWTATLNSGSIDIQYTTTSQGNNRTMRADLKLFRA